MTFKDKQKLKREYTAPYYKKYNIGVMISLIFIIVLVCVFAVCVVLLDDDSFALPVLAIALFASLLIFVIVFLVATLKLRKRLLKQRTEEIENEFSDMPFEEAESELTERKVITEHGLVANLGFYAGKLVVPFKEATVSLHAANIYTKVVAAVLIRDLSGAVVASYILDKTLYNYLLKKGIRIDFQGYTSLMVSEKSRFVKYYLYGSEERTSMAVLFGVMGALLSDEGKNLSYSKKIVLDVLSKEIK